MFDPINEQLSIGNKSQYSQIYMQYQMIDVQITHLELLLLTKLKQIQKCGSQQLILKQKIKSITLLKLYKFLTSLSKNADNLKTKNKSNVKFPQKQSTIITGSSSHNTSINNDQQQQNFSTTCKLGYSNAYNQQVRLFYIWNDIIRQIKMKISCTFIDRAYFCKYGYLFRMTDQYNSEELNIGGYNNSKYGKKLTIDRCQQIVKMNLESSSYITGAYLAQIALRFNSLIQRKQNNQQKQALTECLKFLSKYDDRLEQVKKEEIDTKLSLFSNFPSCPQQCWNSIQYFFEGQLLKQQHCNHDKSWKTFYIPSKDSKLILDGSQYHLIEEMICRSANFGGGVIYMGIDAIEDYRKTDQIMYSIDDKQALLYLQKQKKIFSDLYGRSYEVYGQPRTMLKQKNIRELKQRIRRYGKQNCNPKQLTIVDKIDILPVYKNKIKRLHRKYNPNTSQSQTQTQAEIETEIETEIEQDNTPNYVIKITLTFEQLPNKYLTYIQLSNNQCYLYGEVLGVESIEVRKEKKKAQTTLQQINQYQNRLYSNDIYNQIHSRYNNYKKIQRKCKKYTIKQQQLEKELQLKNFERLCSCWGVKWGGIVSWMEVVLGGGGNGDGGENKGVGKATVEYLQNGNLLGCSVPTSGPNISDPTLYGYIPDLIFNHSTIVVISQSGMKQKDPTKIEQFQTLLKQSKLQYHLYDTFFQKLQNRSSRKLYILTHQKKYQNLKKYSLSLDPKQRSLKLFNIRPQLTLLNSKQFSQAINTITIKFKTLFNTKYKVGQCNQKDQNGKYVTNYYFQFNNKMEACFVFVCLEFQLIKSQFVNKSKVEGLKMFEY